MAVKLLCEISDGLRESEAVVICSDVQGRTHFIRVERDFLSNENGRMYLPVGVVGFDQKRKLVLIELPQEAETGANRLWVREDQLSEPVGAFA